jgi:hypothetical protein
MGACHTVTGTNNNSDLDLGEKLCLDLSFFMYTLPRVHQQSYAIIAINKKKEE